MLTRENLYGYQRHAATFIREHENCALWVDMGLGKTVSGLTAFSDLLHSFDCRRALVVAPLRVASKVWSDEVQTWSHLQGLHVSRIIGTTPAARMKGLRAPADIHTINRENLPWLEAQFIQNGKQTVRWPWDIVFLDESQSFKSQSSQRWKSISRLRPLFPRLVELTGTPAPNGYEDLWAQYNLLDGTRPGSTESAFRDRWFTPPTGQFAKWILRDKGEEEIQAAVADITLSLKAEDYLDLPPVVENFVRVQLSWAALNTYKEMERDLIAQVKGKTLTAVNMGVLDGKLLQLANGAVYVDGKNWVEFHQEKVAALEELLEGISGKVLVAYAFQHDLTRIEKALERSGRKWALLRTDASFAAWAAGEYDVGVLHPASAGHGLNDVYKAGAEDLIHFGLTNNLELYQQVNARLTGGHRRQGRSVKIHHIIAENTRDTEYVALLRKKAVTQDDLTTSLAVRIGVL